MRGNRPYPGRRRGLGDVLPPGRTLAAWTLTVVLVLVAVSCVEPDEDAAVPPPTTRADALPPGQTIPTTPPTTTTSTTRPEAPPTTVHPTEFHVAPDGSDEDAGTGDEPWETLSYAFAQLGAGDTLIVHDGVYREQIAVEVEGGTAEEPVLVRAADGSEPVIEGLLWLRDPDHWVIDGINVTWDDENDDDQHMVKLTDGDDWELRNSELWGARSFAALLVAGTTDGGPSGWRVVNNCIHDTTPSNGRNEDQLIYVNTGPSPTDGLIENNLLFGAENGSGIKLGGSSENEGGAHGVTVRNNTILDTAQGVLVAWQSSANVITGNFFAGTDEGYGHIRGYELVGEGNVAADNGGDDHEPFILNDEGFTGVEDGGDNTAGLTLDLPDAPNCGFVPEAGYGLETTLASMPNS